MLSTCIEDERATVVLEDPLYAKGPIALVLIHSLMPTALSVLTFLRLLPCVIGSTRAAERGLWAGGCRSHLLKIDPFSRSL